MLEPPIRVDTARERHVGAVVLRQHRLRVIAQKLSLNLPEIVLLKWGCILKHMQPLKPIWRIERRRTPTPGRWRRIMCVVHVRRTTAGGRRFGGMALSSELWALGFEP